MNKALKQWVELLAEKEAESRNKAIMEDETKRNIKISKKIQKSLCSLYSCGRNIKRLPLGIYLHS